MLQFALAHVGGHDEKLVFRGLDSKGHHRYDVYDL
jgi:hypothetical protein